MPADERRRYLAPAAFLLAVTIAVVLIRAGLESGGDHAARPAAVVPAPPKHVVVTSTRTTRAKKTKPTATSTTAGTSFWTVQAGDTFGVISSKSGVPVAKIEQLNPNASSTSLHIGEKIRLR